MFSIQVQVLKQQSRETEGADYKKKLSFSYRY